MVLSPSIEYKVLELCVGSLPLWECKIVEILVGYRRLDAGGAYVFIYFLHGKTIS